MSDDLQKSNVHDYTCHNNMIYEQLKVIFTSKCSEVSDDLQKYNVDDFNLWQTQTIISHSQNKCVGVQGVYET